jgi:hypothetical protein
MSDTYGRGVGPPWPGGEEALNAQTGCGRDGDSWLGSTAIAEVWDGLRGGVIDEALLQGCHIRTAKAATVTHTSATGPRLPAVRRGWTGLSIAFRSAGARSMSRVGPAMASLSVRGSLGAAMVVIVPLRSSSPAAWQALDACRVAGQTHPDKSIARAWPAGPESCLNLDRRTPRRC